MALPRPPDTDLAYWADLELKALAYGVDAALSGASRLAVLPPTNLTTDINGEVVVTVPGLDQVAGAILSTTASGYGKDQYMPPVAGGGTGALLLLGPYVPVIIDKSLGGGRIRVRFQTIPQYRASTGQYDTGVDYGTQSARGSTPVTLAGIAWGPA